MLLTIINNIRIHQVLNNAIQLFERIVGRGYYLN